MRRPDQAIAFPPHYHENVESGDKAMTIRIGHRDFDLGKCYFVWPGWCVEGEITDVLYGKAGSLPDGVLEDYGSTDVVEILREYYPDITPDSDVTVIWFST